MTFLVRIRDKGFPHVAPVYFLTRESSNFNLNKTPGEDKVEKMEMQVLVMRRTMSRGSL
jgi:hypothetical protein